MNEASTDIKPGLSVRVVTEVDPAREKISVKTSNVFDVKGESLILAQTDPPILTAWLHKDVFVTYLVKKGSGVARLGVPARIEEFIEYALSSGKTTKAIVVKRTGEARPHNIRMFYRVAPTGQSGIIMTIKGISVNVLDISLGGAKVSHDKALKLETNESMKVSVEMGGSSHGLDARVLRTWDGKREGFDPKLRFASMEFVKMDKTVETALSQRIFNIERESLRKEKGD